MSDRRDNRLPEPGLIVFSTGDDVARGAIAGRLERIGVSQGEVLMLAFVTPNGDTTRIDPEMAVSAGEPDGAGSFLVPGLDVGHAYEIGVWFDIDEDRVFDEGQDLYARALAPVTPDSTGGPTDVRVVLVFADEPGDLTGVVVDSTCAALAVLRQRLAAQADSALAARDSLAARRTTLAASADSLFGLAVAPDGGGSPADTLRQRAERLRAEAAAIVVPDSAAILARRHLPAAALADSLYCSRPVIARFVAAVGDSGILEQRLRTPDGAFRIEDVAPGAYRGAVWRDVEGDGAFAPEEEPGRADIDVWVPPGQEGRVDTLRIGRPAPDPTGGER